MSITMDDEIKSWTARRKSALVLEIIQGKSTIAEASRQFDLPPSAIEEWLEQCMPAAFTSMQFESELADFGIPVVSKRLENALN